ncbi:Crinkler (CRN), partial [Phytophthora megakarya]
MDVDSNCLPRRDPFFSQFSTVDQVGGWLQFSAQLPLTERNTLYVRSSYKSIANQALLKVDPIRRKYAVVTGTPGIGKSVFVYYVMWRLIKDKKRVLFFASDGNFYFDGTTMFTYEALPSKSNLQFWSTDLWCLVDSVDPTSIPGLPYLGCSILLASSPRRDCIGEFKKLVPTPDVFYMPLWTKEEVAEIAPMYPSAADVWQNRFECLGGVPRLVLQDIRKDPQELLTNACTSCSLDDCIMLVSIDSEISSKTKIVQTLIHIHSQEPYQDDEVVYASDLAMSVIVRTKWVLVRAKLQQLLATSDGNRLVQALCGYIFEPYCMNLLENGGKFKYRELLSGNQVRSRKASKRKRGTGTIEIPRSSQPRQIVERVEADQVHEQLYVPQSSNYTAINAWMPQFGGFQMTVGKNHDIKDGAADDLAKLGH